MKATNSEASKMQHDIIWPLNNGQSGMLWVQSSIDHGWWIWMLQATLELGSQDLKGGKTGTWKLELQIRSDLISDIMIHH